MDGRSLAKYRLPAVPELSDVEIAQTCDLESATPFTALFNDAAAKHPAWSSRSSFGLSRRRAAPPKPHLGHRAGGAGSQSALCARKNGSTAPMAVKFKSFPDNGVAKFPAARSWNNPSWQPLTQGLHHRSCVDGWCRSLIRSGSRSSMGWTFMRPGSSITRAAGTGLRARNSS